VHEREKEPASAVVEATTTARFRRQHEELQRLGIAISQKLSRRTLPMEAAQVRRMVAQFAGKLTVHASMENGALYPRLLAHGDPAIRGRAQALFDEVGGIYDAFAGYSAAWPTAASIEADPGGFAKQTRELFTTLAVRMVRENQELYPLVDSLDV
jgi:hypothetical protein